MSTNLSNEDQGMLTAFREFWSQMEKSPRKPTRDEWCFWSVGRACYECLVTWGESKYCYINNGLMGQYARALEVGDLVIASRIAGEIAKLPVRVRVGVGVGEEERVD